MSAHPRGLNTLREPLSRFDLTTSAHDKLVVLGLVSIARFGSASLLSTFGGTFGFSEEIG